MCYENDNPGLGQSPPEWLKGHYQTLCTNFRSLEHLDKVTRAMGLLLSYNETDFLGNFLNFIDKEDDGQRPDDEPRYTYWQLNQNLLERLSRLGIDAEGKLEKEPHGPRDFVKMFNMTGGKRSLSLKKSVFRHTAGARPSQSEHMGLAARHVAARLRHRGQRALLSLAKLQVVGIAGKKVGREGGRIDQVLHRVVSRTVGSGHVWPTPAREAGSAAGVPGPLLQGPQAGRGSCRNC